MSHLSLNQVVELGYCVGCGLCASQSKNGKMIGTGLGSYIPDLDSFTQKEIQNAEEFCPFAKVSDQEDVIAKELFESEDINFLDGLGFYDKTYAAYAVEGSFRNQGSSAGMVNWLCAKLLELGQVDSILHVKESRDDSEMYSFQESRTVEELQSGAKSKYYPIELSSLLKRIENSSSGMIAVVGLPCFIKGLRALEKSNAVLKQKIKFHIGIVCGHLKTKNYAEFLGWQAGVHPQNLRLIDFRTKIESRPASKYGFTAVPKDASSDTWVVKPMSEVVGGNWGHGLFKLKACEYCDDVMAETADIVFGDAWLPEFVNDSNGTNVVNSRSSFLTQLLLKEANEGNIKLIELSAERVLDSQRSGLRHRREGLSYRSLNDKVNRAPFPAKRTPPGSIELDLARKKTYEYRELLRLTSHQSFLLAKSHNDLSIATTMLTPVIESYALLTKRPLHSRVLGKLKGITKRLALRLK